MKETAIEVTDKPRHRSTDFEVEKRVARVEAIIRYKPIHKWKLLKRVQLEFGVSLRTAQEYCLRAKQKLLLHLSDLKSEHRATSLSVYESIINSPKSSNMDKVKAQNSIDELLGLKAPYQSQLQIDANVHGSPSGDGITEEELMAELDSATLDKLLSGIRAAKAKKGIPDNKPLFTAPTRYAGLLPNSKYPPASITEAEVIADDR